MPLAMGIAAEGGARAGTPAEPSLSVEVIAGQHDEDEVRIAFRLIHGLGGDPPFSLDPGDDSNAPPGANPSGPPEGRVAETQRSRASEAAWQALPSPGADGSHERHGDDAVVPLQGLVLANSLADHSSAFVASSVNRIGRGCSSRRSR